MSIKDNFTMNYGSVLQKAQVDVIDHFKNTPELLKVIMNIGHVCVIHRCSHVITLDFSDEDGTILLIEIAPNSTYVVAKRRDALDRAHAAGRDLACAVIDYNDIEVADYRKEKCNAERIEHNES